MPEIPSHNPPSRGRRRERRQRFSNFLATIDSRAGRAEGAVADLVLQAVPALVPVRSARLVTSRPPGETRVGRLTVPVARRHRPDLALEVELDPTRGLDGWDRQQLRDAARVLSLVLEPTATGGVVTGRTRKPRAGARVLVGRSQRMDALRREIARIAPTDFTVLVEGESGSGKELVARQLHALSRRATGPFVAVNCAALVETLLEAELFGIEDRVATGVRARSGKFEAAHRGTLFLDEIGDLSAAAQAKLLRAVQERQVERVGGQGGQQVDIRLVVATNQRLATLVAEGRFRADLFYRLSGVELDVPPLRERRDDVVELAEHFLARHRQARPLRLAESAADALKAYDWPGNVRELERAMEHAVTLVSGDEVRASDLPARLTRQFSEVLQPSLARGDTMRTWGSRYARLVLERCDRNKRRACEVLGISYHTLQAYLRHVPRQAEVTGSLAGASTAREQVGESSTDGV